MIKKISGAEYALAKIFSSDFEYVIPPYQRPYAWTEDQASELFDDLYDFHRTEKEEGYFLGSIVLIKQESRPHSEVIDGQQRLTTLTILLSSLAFVLKDEQQRDILCKYIREPGNEFESLEPKPRLTLREKDREFFEQYIQTLSLEDLCGLDDKKLSNESQVNIKKNCELFLSKIEERLNNNEENIKNFIKFLMQRCYLVAVSTPSQQSAFRVFSVMNSRGLDLQPTDIIKADVIGKFTSDQDREVYNERWEDMEVELGRGGFNDLFTYVRMIYAKRKAQTILLEEFRDHVLSKISEPEALIDDVLEPFSKALHTVRERNYGTEDVNRYLRWLDRIYDSDWIPPAILFLSQKEDESEYVAWFFKKLERLAAYTYICALNVNRRLERYNDVIRALEENHSMSSPIQAIELTELEKKMMREALNGDVYRMIARRRNYLILRLDSFLSDGAASYDSRILSIEHVLPQVIDETSEWATLWPDEQQREEWVHRIANLVPLNRQRNSQAQNYDFERKKTAYFVGRKNVSSYALTSQVINSTQWTPEYLAERQAELLSVLEDNWELGSDIDQT